MPLQNLFVAKLPRNLNDSDLEQIFADYNPISAKIMLDASTGKSKGFGFVLFSSEEAGRLAYVGMNRRHVVTHSHHFNLCVFPSQHSGRAAVAASPALYIRNIPVTVPQPQVEQFLRSFGTLAYCAMREDHYGNPVWVVYAEYDCLECSRNALQRLHGRNCYFSASCYIMAKYADSDEAKRERQRRREEGKLAPAPAAPRSVCLLPPSPPFTTPVPPAANNNNNNNNNNNSGARHSPGSPVGSSVSGSGSVGPDTGDEAAPRKSLATVYRHNPYNLRRPENNINNAQATKV